MHSLNYWYYIASYKEQLLVEICPFLNLLHFKKKKYLISVIQCTQLY